MEHEMVVRLTDDKYTVLTAEAEENGQNLEDLIQDLLDEVIARRILLSAKSDHPRTRREISEILYYGGLTERIPSGEPLSTEEAAELERLGNLLGQAEGKSASEMVIEDRGPY